jgi:UDP-MurNAc hydroxylase
MRVTSVGHAGMLIDTVDGSILCDPWFIPAFFGSWFVFPRNDQLSPELMERIEHPTYLYISHLHADHFDEPWLAEHVDRATTVLIPGYPTHELERRIRALGFDDIYRTRDGEEVALGPNLRVAIHVETSITDGPGGDSALVVSDGTARLVNQNDCRTDDLDALRAHGPVDLHWLQYSGAIWYPMVYDEPPARMRELVDAKVASQFSRAMRYVEAVNATAVVPSAGPPAFLDPELWRLNVIDGDELSIFPDQPSFMERLAAAGHRGVLAIPGTTIELTTDSMSVTHPLPATEVEQIFRHKAEYLRGYQADWMPWLTEMHRSWNPPSTDLLATLRAWWEPLLAMAPALRHGVGDRCLLHAGDLAVLIDFPEGQVREFAGETYAFRFDIQRELVETVVASRAVDWSNALFLSCRFRAWRAGSFNEYVYNFFKSLSPERMRRTEAEARRRLDPTRDGLAAEEIRFGDYMVERLCPHRQADLSVFGEVDGGELVCTLHGWRFDLATGKCLTADDRTLRVRRADN